MRNLLKLCRDLRNLCRDEDSKGIPKIKYCEKATKNNKDIKRCKFVTTETNNVAINIRRAEIENIAKNVVTNPQQSQRQGKRLLCHDIDQICHDKDAYKEKQVIVATLPR